MKDIISRNDTGDVHVIDIKGFQVKHRVYFGSSMEEAERLYNHICQVKKWYVPQLRDVKPFVSGPTEVQSLVEKIEIRVDSCILSSRVSTEDPDRLVHTVMVKGQIV